MSQENAEIVRRMYDAYASGDFETAMAYLDPEIEMDLTLRPDGKVFHGHVGVTEAVRTWLGAWEDWRLEVEEIIDLRGDRVLVLATESGRGKGSGIEIEHPHGMIATVRSGKIVRTVGYVERSEALEAAGLSE
jgi:ketosteroid isomerase-like protein